MKKIFMKWAFFMLCMAVTMPAMAQFNVKALKGAAKAVKAVTLTDAQMAEYVKEFKDADVTLTVTELPLQAAKTMFGHEISEADKSVTYAIGDNANYVGYGFCAQEIKGGEVSYTAAWLPKVKFGDPAESFTTKGDSITFGTPQVSGKAAADSTGKWTYKQTFATKEEALTWLKGKASIA